MPKMKTKSSVKKRFKLSASGKVIATQANKRHNMRKRSNRQLREQRGTTVLSKIESKAISSIMPYAKK